MSINHKPLKININDATDRLNCMAREIHIPDSLKTLNPTLAKSREKDKELLYALIPLVNSMTSLCVLENK